MTVWIILFWVVGVVVLVAVAVWRGYKNGPTVFKSSSSEAASDIDSVRRELELAQLRSSQAANRTDAELKSLRSEIERLSQKIEAQESISSKKVSSNEPSPVKTSISTVLDEMAKNHGYRFGDLYLSDLDSHSGAALVHSAQYEDLQRKVEALLNETGRSFGKASSRYYYDPQRPKAPMLTLPFIAK